MTTVVYLKDRKPVQDDLRGWLPVTQMLNDLSREAGDLSNDWLFQMASPEVKRAMLRERGITVAETA